MEKRGWRRMKEDEGLVSVASTLPPQPSAGPPAAAESPRDAPGPADDDSVGGPGARGGPSWGYWCYWSGWSRAKTHHGGEQPCP